MLMLSLWIMGQDSMDYRQPIVVGSDTAGYASCEITLGSVPGHYQILVRTQGNIQDDTLLFYFEARSKNWMILAKQETLRVGNLVQEMGYEIILPFTEKSVYSLAAIARIFLNQLENT